jgi:hypothetical protein
LASSSTTTSSSNLTSAALSKEYREACGVLNVDTMNHVCRLLLQGYGSGGVDANSDGDETTGAGSAPNNISTSSSSSKKSDNIEEELLEIYHKCKNAAATIQKHQPSVSVAAKAAAASSLLPGAPNLRGPSVAGGSGGGMGSLLSSSSTMAIGYVKGQPVPMRRTNMHGLVGKPTKGPAGIGMKGHHHHHNPHHHHHFHQRGNLVGTATGIASGSGSGSISISGGGRDRSNSDASNVSSSSGNPSKRQRLSPTPNESNSSSTSTAAAPPKSALKFLAKLNKGGDPNSKLGGAEGTADGEESMKMARTNDTEDSESNDVDDGGGSSSSGESVEEIADEDFGDNPTRKDNDVEVVGSGSGLPPQRRTPPTRRQPPRGQQQHQKK